MNEDSNDTMIHLNREIQSKTEILDALKSKWNLLNHNITLTDVVNRNAENRAKNLDEELKYTEQKIKINLDKARKNLNDITTDDLQSNKNIDKLKKIGFKLSDGFAETKTSLIKLIDLLNTVSISNVCFETSCDSIFAKKLYSDLTDSSKNDINDQLKIIKKQDDILCTKLNNEHSTK